MGKLRPIQDRLSEKTMADPNSGCWLFTGALDGAGYGCIGRNGRLVGAHIASYELVYGPVQKGLQLDHKCRVRSCINPDHLEPVTSRENCLRGIGPSALAARQTHCVHNHPLDGENLLIGRSGRRFCRECNRNRSRLMKLRKSVRLRGCSDSNLEAAGAGGMK